MGATLMIEDAIKLRERDLRIRRLADSAFAATYDDMRERYGLFAPELEVLLRDATQRIAVHLVAMIYEGDAELKALRHERDAYKDQAVNALNFTLPSAFIVPDSPSKSSG